FSVRRDGPAELDLLQWRSWDSCLRFGGVGVRARAATLVSRSSLIQTAAAIQNGGLGRSFSSIQRLHDVFFYDCRKTVGGVETGQRRDLVSNHAVGLVPFPKCGV